MSRLAALYKLGLDISDVPPMKHRVLARIARRNAELMEGFR